jgi:hypothetical protein
MKKVVILLVSLLHLHLSYAQQNYYDITPGDGYGLRLWSSNSFKIHMGNGSEYHYGSVTDYSIKTSMDNTPGRGWTWGIAGQTPIAGLSTSGHLRIAGDFSTPGMLAVDGVSTLKGIRIPGRYNVGQYDAAIEIEIPSSSYNAIRAFNGISERGTIHFFDSSWGSSLPSNSAGAVNIMGANAVTVGAWNDGSKMTYFRKSDGFVGIGTANPDSKLTVKGIIHAEEVKLDLLVPGPDYVFEESYLLLPLKDTKAYVRQNKHLPGIPSSDDMQQNGVNLLEMNMKLLEKVEELTLYLIEQSERILSLEAKLKTATEK